MLNCHYTRGSVGATTAHGPSGIQPTLDLNRDYPFGAGQNPNWAQTPGDGCSWWSKACTPQESAK
jgi:hypothetical protein